MYKIEKRKLKDLIPAEYNPRKELTSEDEEYHKIKRSIEKFGYVDLIIINNDGTIIGGHQRYNVLRDLGFNEIDVIVLDLNKQDEKALNVALNKISGEWDEVALRDLLVDLDLEDFDVSLTGFNEKEIDELLELTDFEAEVEEDGFNEGGAYQDSQKEGAIVRPGEVWQLGNHRLMCGDATKKEDVLKLLGDEKLDLVITDPPYGVDLENKMERLKPFRVNNNNAKPISNDALDTFSFNNLLCKAFENMDGCMRNGAAIYVFHADAKGLIFRQAFEDAGFRFSQVIIWEKNNFAIGKSDYQWRHEPILYGWKEGAAHYFVKDRTQDTVIIEDEINYEEMKKSELVEMLKKIQDSMRDKTTVIYEKKPLKNNLHPTMKPLELVGKFMKNSSKRDWNVGDFFAGSGSTLMVAEQLGRNAFCMELDEHYASVIIKRWEEYTGLKAIRIGE